MAFNEVCVLFALAVCSFVANVLHGLTGCGSILVLQALWQTAVTIAPDVMHSTKAFGIDNVKSVAEFSYVLTFFIQSVHSGLLFYDERRKRAHQLEQGMLPSPSQLNGVLLLAFIPCSFVGAALGMYTMPLIRESGARIILGGSSLFFALTFLSLYQMKFLERKKTEDVIRDDLMLMRIQSDVQRHVIVQYMEDERRRKARRERRRRHRRQRKEARRAERLHRRELRMRSLAASATSGMSGGGSNPAAAASPLVVVPAVERREEGAVAMAELEGAPLEPNVAPATSSPFHPQRRTASLPEVYTSPRTSRPLGVHGSSQHTASHAQMMGDVHLPDSVLSGGSDNADGTPNAFAHRRHHLHRLWIKDVDVQSFVRQRLAEISRAVDDEDEEVARDAKVAAWTLQAMEGHDGEGGGLLSPADGGRRGSSTSSSSVSGDGSDTELDESTVTSSSRAGGLVSHDGAGSEAGDGREPPTRAVRFDASADEREALHRKWKQLLGKQTKDGDEGSVDLSKSIAMAAAAAPRRVVMGHSEVLNIGLREAQQQQLKNLHGLASGEHDAGSHHHRLVHFVRMDGGVVMSAMVSSFFSGLFGSYTGVAHPPLTIFALAMDISVSELRVNYAVSSIVPAALRAVVGIADGFANTALFKFYLVAILFAWGGVGFGLYISNRNAVSQATFMVAILSTLLLVSFLMVVPMREVVLRCIATAVCLVAVVYAILQQQKPREHRRPPAPPNTPATAAEVEAFELYWRQHSRRQRAMMDYENDGSVVSMTSTTTAGMEESGRSMNSSSTGGMPAASVPPAAGKKRQTAAAAAARGATLPQRERLELEDLPVRAREDASEELITIVPVKAK